MKWWLQKTVTHDALEELRQRSGIPAVVFHGAGTGTVGRASAAPQEAFTDTVTSTQVVTEFLGTAAPRSKLVYPSSCAVYGAEAPRPTPETAKRSPTSLYGQYKAEAEDICGIGARDHGLKVAVIRFFSIYGAGLRKQLLWEFCQRALKAPAGSAVQLQGTGEETRDFLHVEDAARLVGICSDEVRVRGAPARFLVVNGGTGTSVSIADAACILLQALSLPVRVRFSGDKVVGDPPHYLASIDKCRELGFEPSWTFEEGAVRFAEWAASIERREADEQQRDGRDQRAR